MMIISSQLFIKVTGLLHFKPLKVLTIICQVMLCDSYCIIGAYNNVGFMLRILSDIIQQQQQKKCDNKVPFSTSQ